MLTACGRRSRQFGIPQEFLPHAGRAELLEDIGLTPQEIARFVVELMVERMPVDDPLVEADLG